MTSSDERRAALGEALRRHPRRAMTTTELAARTGATDLDEFDAHLADLAATGVVATYRGSRVDPHFPAVAAVALVEDGAGAGAGADADRRARECVAVVERQLMRSHRCQ